MDALPTKAHQRFFIEATGSAVFPLTANQYWLSQIGEPAEDVFRRSLLEKEIHNLEAERAPEIAIDPADIDQALAFFTDILKTAEAKKVRLFFSTFVQSITLEADRVHIAYHPEKLVSIAGGGKLPAATVHSSGRDWLPKQRSIRTASIGIALPERWRVAA